MTRTIVVALVSSLLSSLAMAQAPATNQPPAAPSSATSTTATRPPATTSASTQFPDEAAAKSHCPTDTVVWVNLSSKVYHLSGTPYYGNTKKGAYICQRDADVSGFRVAKGEVASRAKH
jgi:hypothetical protein